MQLLPFMKTRLWLATALVGVMACSNDEDDGFIDAGVDAGVDASSGLDARDTGLSDGKTDGAADARIVDANTAVDANTSTDAALPPGDAFADAVTADAPSSAITGFITVVAGGQIPLQEARVLALRGSVAADRNITLSVAPAPVGTQRLADINGSIYHLEPADLQFDAPAQFAVMAKGTLPAGKQATLARLESNGTWTPVQSIWDDRTSQVSGLILRGGRYALLLEPTSTDVACPAASTCGGTLSGSYQYTAECLRMAAPMAPATCGSENSATVSSITRRTGTISFSGFNYETNLTINTTVDVRAEQACTSFGQNAGDATCADLASRLVQSKLYTWSCSGDMNNRCFCSGSLQVPQQRSGVFFANDGKLRLTPLAGANETTQDYCVAGNALTVGDTSTVFSLTKAP